MNFNYDKRFEDHVKETIDQMPEKNKIALFLQGSQNYNLDIEGSDVDTKLIVVPTLMDIVLNKQPASYTHVRKNNEHIDVKDIRLMFECFKKQNINFLEILFTNTKAIFPGYEEEIETLLSHAEEIARYNPYKAIGGIKGMSMQKLAALQHPYPSKAEVLATHGYDPKQLHHIVRLYYCLYSYLTDGSFQAVLKLDQSTNNFLIDIKKGKIELKEALALAEEYNRATVDLADFAREKIVNKDNLKTEKILNEILYSIISKSIKLELAE